METIDPGESLRLTAMSLGWQDLCKGPLEIATY